MSQSKIESKLRSYKEALSRDPDPQSRGSGYLAGPIKVTLDPEKSKVDPGIVPEAPEINICDVGGVEETKGDDHNLGFNLGKVFVQNGKNESAAAKDSMAGFEPAALGSTYQPEVTSAAKMQFSHQNKTAV